MKKSHNNRMEGLYTEEEENNKKKAKDESSRFISEGNPNTQPVNSKKKDQKDSDSPNVDQQEEVL